MSTGVCSSTAALTVPARSHLAFPTALMSIDRSHSELTGDTSAKASILVCRIEVASGLA